MHPTTHYELMQARVADLHRQAERRNLVLVARQTPRGQRQPGTSRRSEWAGRLFRVPRRWQPGRDTAT